MYPINPSSCFQFRVISPWGQGEETGLTLCERLFRLMDSNHDNLVNFKEIVQVFDGICKGDHTKKLKVLFCLHLPGVVLPGELDPDTVDSGDTEVGCSAEDFFDGANKAIEATTESLREGLKLTASPTPKYNRNKSLYRKQVGFSHIKSFSCGTNCNFISGFYCISYLWYAE